MLNLNGVFIRLCISRVPLFQSIPRHGWTEIDTCRTENRRINARGRRRVADRADLRPRNLTSSIAHTGARRAKYAGKGDRRAIDGYSLRVVFGMYRLQESIAFANNSRRQPREILGVYFHVGNFS